jgi:hypothetical protein
MSRARLALLSAVLVTVTLALAGQDVWRGEETPPVARALQPDGARHITGPTKVTVRDLPSSGGAPEQAPKLHPPRRLARGSAGGIAPTTPVGSAGSASGPQISNAHFPGLDNGINSELLGINLTPPDPQLAVGPGAVVEMVNVAGRIYDRNGATLGTFSLGDFFNVVSGHTEFDPRIAYDAPSGRWFASLASFKDNPSGTDAGRLYFAVSDSDDPAGTWNVYTLSYNNVFPDQPAFGLTDDKFTLSSNIFDVDGPPGIVTAGCSPSDGYCGDEIVVIQKSDLVAGVAAGALRLHAFPYDDSSFTVRPAVSLSSTNDQYLTTFDTSHIMRVLRITGTPETSDVSIATATSLNIIANSTAPPSRTLGAGICIVGDAHVGSPPCIDSGDERPLNVVWRDNRLWTASTSACRPAGDTAQRSCAHLIEVDTSGTPTVSQDIMYGSVGQYYSYPAVTVDASGNLYVPLTHTNTGIFAEAVLAGRQPGDPPSTLSTTSIVRAGNVVHTSGRWGDYLGAAVDPSATSCVWIVGEYSGVVPGPSFDWATDIAAASYDASCPSVTLATATPTRTPTNTRTPTPAHSVTPVPSHTPTAVLATVTSTPSPSPTDTPGPTDTPTPSDTPTRTATATPVTLAGDANCDHTVNPIDAAVTLQYVAALIHSLPCLQAADANNDGQTNALDAALILQFAARLIDRLPPT